MTLGGWMTRVMFDRYNIIDEADLPQAVAKGFSGKQTANTATPTAPISPLSSFAATPGQVAQLVEQRTENQLPGRAASVLLALTRYRLVGKRNKPSRAVAVVPSGSECESHGLSHCGATKRCPRTVAH